MYDILRYSLSSSGVHSTCDYVRCYWRNKILRAEVMFVAYSVPVSICTYGK